MELTDSDKQRIRESFHKAFPYSSGAGMNEFVSGYHAATKYERAKQAIEWIDVNDRLPQNNEMVLCYNHYKMMRSNSYSEGSDQDAEWFKRTFSHWAILPNEPKL